MEKINISTEINALISAKNNLSNKLTELFKDKWVIAENFDKLYRKGRYAKNKNGDIIVFKIKWCRPKACSLESLSLLDSIVLEGLDPFDSIRHLTVNRVNNSKDDVISLASKNKELEYDVRLFETKDEALLFAELNMDNNDVN